MHDWSLICCRAFEVEDISHAGFAGHLVLQYRVVLGHRVVHAFEDWPVVTVHCLCCNDFTHVKVILVVIKIEYFWMNFETLLFSYNALFIRQDLIVFLNILARNLCN